MRQPNPPDPYLPVYGRGDQPQGEPAQPAPRKPHDSTAPRLLWRLTLAQCIIAGGGLLIVLGTFLSWFTVTFTLFLQQQTSSISGWDVPTGKAALLLGLGALLFLALQIFGVRLPTSVVEREVVLYMATGIETFILAGLYLLDGPRIITSGGFYSSGPGLGLYIALIGSAAIATGGFLRQRESRSWLL